MKIYPRNNRFIKEVLEQQEYRFLHSYPIVIDIGANIGTFSIWIYNNADRIYAIEPVKKNVEHLLKTIARNKLDKISVHEIAISDSNITKKIEVRGTAEDGAWRISEAGTYPVRCQTLEDFMNEQKIEYADLVKLDVENHEAAILGTPRFPHYKIGTIIGECHEDTDIQVRNTLTYMGYKYRYVSGNHFIARK
jgi:FkbM family methyltransferase